MIIVERTVVVAAPLDGLVAYLEDFSHAEEWDPGTVRCVRIGDGPVGVGARWRNTSRFRGRETELVYRLASRERDRLVFEGENKTAATTDDMAFVAMSDAVTRLTYRASLRFKGLARLASPFLRAEFDRLADETATRLPVAVSARFP
ncbi:SRPBCC family protein [Streptomyces sp. NPDC101158]|uniref:SRPBCC family protein n=1 Tax=Streptomyces sp. NPDC101158 TaxID=3366117 RepID=UPI003819E688